MRLALPEESKFATQSQFDAALRKLLTKCRKDIEFRLRVRTELKKVYVREHFRAYTPPQPKIALSQVKRRLNAKLQSNTKKLHS